eukprot:364255-Chlamydomonas_euryale.AAC.4
MLNDNAVCSRTARSAAGANDDARVWEPRVVPRLKHSPVVRARWYSLTPRPPHFQKPSQRRRSAASLCRGPARQAPELTPIKAL